MFRSHASPPRTGRLSALVIHPSAVFFSAAIFLVMPAKNALLSLLAAALHEAGHLAAALAAGMHCKKLTIYPFGADIRLAGLSSYRTDRLIALAGPLANLLFFFCFLSLCPFFSAANLVLAALNLLPIASLDGGSLLHALIAPVFGPDTARRTVQIFSAITLILIWCASIYLLLYHDGDPTLFLFCAGLFSALYLR